LAKSATGVAFDGVVTPSDQLLVQSLPAQGVRATTYQSIDELPHQSVVGSHSRQTADSSLDTGIAVCRNEYVRI
jgi:hypothetical protein